jgi:hypothetical protein
MSGRYLCGGDWDLNASGPGKVGRVGEQSGAVSGHLRLLSLPSDAPDNGSGRSAFSTVASGLSDEVASALRRRWMAGRSPVTGPAFDAGYSLY